MKSYENVATIKNFNVLISEFIIDLNVKTATIFSASVKPNKGEEYFSKLRVFISRLCEKLHLGSERSYNSGLGKNKLEHSPSKSV